MADLDIRLLGVPQITWKGQPTQIRWRKATAMIAYLALHPHAHNRTVLADLLWPDLSNSRANLRRLLYNLKSTGISDWLLTDEATISINPTISIQVDALDMETLMKADGNATEESLKQAVDLYVDEFMSGFSLDDASAFNDWVQHRRQVFHRYHIDAMESLARIAFDAGRLPEATEYANRIIEIDPLMEPIHRMLMRTYVQMKQRDRAISQYHQLVRFLRDELGLTPQEATRKLYEDLLHAEVRPEDTEPLINIRESAAVSLLPPLPEHIIGRDNIQHTLHDHILYEDTPAIALWGIPGIGKTALVSACIHDKDVQAMFPDGIFWVTAGEQPDIRKQLEIWCGTLGVIPEATTETTTMKIRATIASRRMLIVIDDVWTDTALQPFSVGGTSSKTIITTRFPGIARHFAGPGGLTLHIPSLTQASASELILRYAPDMTEDYTDETARILKTLNGLPLALTHLGDQVASEYEIGLVDAYLEDLLEDVTSLLTSVPPADGLASPMDRKRSIIGRLRTTVEHGPSPQIASYLPDIQQEIAAGDVMSVNGLVSLWGKDVARQRIREMADAGILIPVGQGQFTCHSLWQYVME